MSQVYVMVPRAGRGSLGERLLSAVGRAWTRYQTRRAEHATVAILNSLDDRTLRDIGLHRSEIRSAVCGRASERRIGLSRQETPEVRLVPIEMCV